MSGSAPTNNQAVEFEQQQAAQAAATEAQRQARLTAGTNMINSIFDFSPATPASTSNYDWSKFLTPGGGTTSALAAAGDSIDASGQVQGPTASNAPAGYKETQGPGGAWGLTDPSGKFYAQGTPISITTPAKAAGGFGPDFYNQYTQKVLDYYQPQEQKQYAEAQRDLTFNLARAGTLNSTVAADKTGDLAYNDALSKASIVANANTQTGQLQQQIQGNKQSLLNQLYATEDPTETANLAESSAKASQLQDPTLTPAAAFFTPALTAVGGVGQSLTSQYSPLTATGAPIVQPPAVASASSTSDKVFR